MSLHLTGLVLLLPRYTIFHWSLKLPTGDQINASISYWLDQDAMPYRTRKMSMEYPGLYIGILGLILTKSHPKAEIPMAHPRNSVREREGRPTPWHCDVMHVFLDRRECVHCDGAWIRAI